MGAKTKVLHLSFSSVYKTDNVQNSTKTIYKIDNLVCTGMLGANLKCNKYVC